MTGRGCADHHSFNLLPTPLLGTSQPCATKKPLTSPEERGAEPLILGINVRDHGPEYLLGENAESGQPDNPTTGAWHNLW